MTRNLIRYLVLMNRYVNVIINTILLQILFPATVYLEITFLWEKKKCDLPYCNFNRNFSAGSCTPKTILLHRKKRRHDTSNVLNSRFEETVLLEFTSDARNNQFPEWEAYKLILHIIDPILISLYSENFFAPPRFLWILHAQSKHPIICERLVQIDRKVGLGLEKRLRRTEASRLNVKKHNRSSLEALTNDTFIGCFETRHCRLRFDDKSRSWAKINVRESFEAFFYLIIRYSWWKDYGDYLKI